MDRRDFLLSCAASLVAGCGNPLSPFGASTVDGPTGVFGGLHAKSTGPPVLGINSHLLRDPDLKLIRELGFTHVRSTLISSLWADNVTYAASMREHTARVADHGLGMLYVVHNAHGKVFRSPDDPAAAREFTTIVVTMLEALPEVESWQLWNEMDVWLQAPFGTGHIPPRSAFATGVNYAAWWRDAYERLKNRRPEALFVTGGVADLDSERGWDFLRGVASRGIEADALGLHAYGRWDRARARCVKARKIVGDTIPVWLTEFSGKPGSFWTPEYQAEAVRDVIEGNQATPYFARIYSYCLETDPNDPWYGLRNVDGSPRPLLDWLHERAAASAVG